MTTIATTFTYVTSQSGGPTTYLWSSASNWSGGAVPIDSGSGLNTTQYTVVVGAGPSGSVALDDVTNDTIRQLTVNAGAVVEIASGNSLAVITSVTGAGEVEFLGAGTGLSAGNAVGITSALAFDGVSRSVAQGEVITLSAISGARGQDTAAVTGFAAGDRIDFTDFTSMSAPVLSNGTLTVSGSTAAGSASYSFTNFSEAGNPTLVTVSDGAIGYSVEAVCFAAGTRLLTPTGERAVEDLREGDMILTAHGESLIPRPINWVGQMRVDLAHHPRPEAVAPIQVRRGAFAENIPHRDLLVSPEHCLFVDGHLIAAKSLVNGATITQDFDRPAIAYYHIETTPHAIVLAEGLPAETYLDTGNRAMFDNAGAALVLHPEFHINTALRAWETHACAPLASTPEQIAPAWNRLADRAVALGYTIPTPVTVTDAAPHLRVQGHEILPLTATADRLTFVLPAGATSAALVSRHGSPADLAPWRNDHRRLGLAIARIVLRDAAGEREIALDSPALTRGWHPVERSAGAAWRWTDGAALLPLPGHDSQAILEIDLAGSMTYCVAADTVEASRHAA